ncbi:MAG: T9SS C-terminal target domain-containing protein, partial [Bacteroidetes bacterium]
VFLRGNTTGLEFSDNTFTYEGTEEPSETLVGSNCHNLLSGLNNTIRRNSYINLHFGNQASGNNGYDPDGLLYLCNFHSFGISKWAATPYDYQIPNGSVRKVQGEDDQAGRILPTGNVFADAGFTFYNSGMPVDYYFYDGDPQQDPLMTGLGAKGIEEFEVNDPNQNCGNPEPPCHTPPCPISDTKERFFRNRNKWKEQLALLPNLTDSAQLQQAEDSLRILRLRMNRDGSAILMHYSLDSNAVLADSLLTYLQLLETYPTDLRLAGHHFFSGDFEAFDALWPQLPEKHELDSAALLVYQALGEVYSTLRPHLEAGGDLRRLPDSTRNHLLLHASFNDEAGLLAQSLLWGNGIRVEPDCQSAQPRNAARSPQSLASSEPPRLRLHPNPTAGTLFVQAPQEALPARVRVHDLHGKLLLQSPLNSPAHTLD